MYTLLVSGSAAEQDHGVFRMDTGRFLEFTDEALVAKLKPVSAEAVDLLRMWPCVLMEEGRADEKARIGRITEASQGRREISLTFEPLWLRPRYRSQTMTYGSSAVHWTLVSLSSVAIT